MSNFDNSLKPGKKYDFAGAHITRHPYPERDEHRISLLHDPEIEQQIDPAIRQLCRLINSVKGLGTIGSSCSGHLDVPAKRNSECFEPRISSRLILALVPEQSEQVAQVIERIAEKVKRIADANIYLKHPAWITSVYDDQAVFTSLSELTAGNYIVSKNADGQDLFVLEIRIGDNAALPDDYTGGFLFMKETETLKKCQQRYSELQTFWSDLTETVASIVTEKPDYIKEEFLPYF